MAAAAAVYVAGRSNACAWAGAAIRGVVIVTATVLTLVITALPSIPMDGGVCNSLLVILTVGLSQMYYTIC